VVNLIAKLACVKHIIPTVLSASLKSFLLLVYDLCETGIASYGQKNDRKSALSTIIGFVLFLAKLLNLLGRSTI
jgi:hypothetical protein